MVQEHLMSITNRLDQIIKEVFENGTYQEYLDVKSALEGISNVSAGLITEIDERVKLFAINKEIIPNENRDFIVKFTYSLGKNNPIIKRIENTSRKTVEALLRRVNIEVEDNLEDEITSFFRDQDIIIQAESSKLRSYDFECDLNNNEIVDAKHIFKSREQVADSDVIIKYCAMGSEDSYEKITNMSRDEVEVLLEKLKASVKDGYEGAEFDFLVGHGAEIDMVLEEWGNDTIYENTFYDFEYDVDANEVTDSKMLPIREQAEFMLNRMEHKEILFDTEERAALIDYAEYDQNVENMHDIAKAVVLEELNINEMVNLPIQQEKSIPLGNVDLWNGIEVTNNEEPLLYGQDDYFGIYQLKQEEFTTAYRFESIEQLERKGLLVEKDHYDLVYQGTLRHESLDDLFEHFNFDRPEDYGGRSLSVSDIVVTRNKGQTRAHYVDSFGFKEIEDFYQQEQKQEKTELAYAVEEKYIVMQVCEIGYDYSLYDQDYRLIDEGILETEEYRIEQAAREIITDLYGDIPLFEVDYDELIQITAEKSAIDLKQDSSVIAGDTKQGQGISFYVAENGEFHSGGEFHDGLTLQEAIAIYHTIPEERMHAGKAIGFELQTGLDGIFSEASMELFCFNTIGMDNIENIEWIRGNALIWEAMIELAEAFPDAKIENRESIKRFAEDLIAFGKEEFSHEYRNSLVNDQDGVNECIDLLTQNNMKMNWREINELIEDKSDIQVISRAQKLIQRGEDIWLRRKQNPVNKVGELEEHKFYKISEAVNDIVSEKGSLQGSIHMRLIQAKEILGKGQEGHRVKGTLKKGKALEN